MVYNLTVGEEPLRKEVVDKVIKGMAKNLYKFLQAVSVTSTNAWSNVYYREASAALTSNSVADTITGIPRGANFPQASVTWEKVTGWLKKYGLEENIYWEDVKTNDLDVQSRTLFKIAEGVAASVDAEIWDGLTVGRTNPATTIKGFRIVDGSQWVFSSAAIIDDLMHAKQLIGESNYDTSNLMAFISQKDHRSIVSWLSKAGAQFPTIGNEVATNGRSGKLAGIQLILSNNVTASYALVCVPKICATWREAVPLSTDTLIDPFKSIRIRAVQMGQLQLTDPEAVCLIQNTQGVGAV